MALLAAIVLVLILQVFSRYVLNQSLSWSDEAAGLLLVWLMFLGAPAMLKRQSHMEIFLFGGLGRLQQRGLRILSELACGLFYGIVLVGSLDLVASMRVFRTPALDIRGDYTAMVLPVACLLLLLRTAIRIRDLCRSGHPDWLGRE